MTGTTVCLEPWKEDGNIIIVAEEKSFRVHRSVLSSHSEVFKDMFDCAGSNEGEKALTESCPVVHLQDAADDVQIMLKALYDRSYPLPWHQKIPMSLFVVFIHMGAKYVISALIKEARLRCAIEPTMDSAAMLTPPHPANLFPEISDGDPHNFQIMNVLQEVGLKAPLPLAMYQCLVSCTLTDVADGYEFNGTVYSLSPANLRTYIRMKDAIEGFRVQLMSSLYTAQNCSRLRCADNIHRLWSDYIAFVPPFDHWKSGWEKLFCARCKVSLARTHKEVMKETWNKVPEAVGFDSWAEIAKSGDFPSLTINTF